MNWGCWYEYIENYTTWFMTIKWIPANTAHHLFIFINISIGDGLYLSFIYAWKSGIKPSVNKLPNKKTNPIN